MTNEFRKILDLIKRTGDKMVFYDSVSDSGFVVLPLAEYEKMLSTKEEVKGLTEEELLAKINRDIARWRSEQRSEEITVEETIPAESAATPTLTAKLAEKVETPAAPAVENQYQFEPLEEPEVKTTN